MLPGSLAGLVRTAGPRSAYWKLPLVSEGLQTAAVTSPGPFICAGFAIRMSFGARYITVIKMALLHLDPVWTKNVILTEGLHLYPRQSLALQTSR